MVDQPILAAICEQLNIGINSESKDYKDKISQAVDNEHNYELNLLKLKHQMITEGLKQHQTMQDYL